MEGGVWLQEQLHKELSLISLWPPGGRRRGREGGERGERRTIKNKCTVNGIHKVMDISAFLQVCRPYSTSHSLDGYEGIG